ncbi:cytochrome P450 [Streptomyces sp. NPDC056707]|uniref:cytochrome P450 n=1 Tax=Streptomyces sp. NPDC056707 TaxID=3345919 RepID=UPI0036CEFC6D
MGPMDRVPLYGADFVKDPTALYNRLRPQGPIVPVELAPGVEASLVLDYEVALEVLRSPQIFSKDARRWRALAEDRIPADSSVLPVMKYRPNCRHSDGEEHIRLRRAVTDSLDRVDPNALRKLVEDSADNLIDQFSPTGQADLLTEYAALIPVLVFQLVYGCPPEIGERLTAGLWGVFDGVDAHKANAMLSQGLVDLVSLKRSKPGADATSWMMAHPAQLTDEEMVHQLAMLLGAGSEPQQNLIANGLRLLLSDDRFAGDLSGGSLPVEEALDEVLWADPPFANFGIHYPMRDVDVAGVRLREGEPVVVSFAAANNDPSLGAVARRGNRAHLAWSAGPHTCPAQSPARLIAAVAIEQLLDRIPDLELAVSVDQLVWRPGPFHRALTALPVRFTPVEPHRVRRRSIEAAPLAADQVRSAPTVGDTFVTTPGWSVSRLVWRSVVAWWHGR